MGKKQKGQRRERQARDILTSLEYEVVTPNATKFQREDFFGLFDIIAVKPDCRPLLVQVKSNRASGINEFTEQVSERMPEKFVDVQFWVCHDGEGWRAMEVKNGNYEVIFDGREFDGNMGDGLKNYLRPNITES